MNINFFAAVFPLLLKMIKEAMDAGVDGKTVAAKYELKEAFQIVHGLLEVKGDDIAKLIPGDVDDQALAEIQNFVIDTAKEGEFPLLSLVNLS